MLRYTYLIFTISLLQSCQSIRNIQVQDYEETEVYLKCTANCLVDPESYKPIILPIIKFEDISDDIAFAKTKVRIVREPKYVKKVDRNCLAANPNDCFESVLLEQADAYTSYYVLLDTSVTQNYIFKTFDEHNLYIHPSPLNLEERKVICPTDLSIALLQEIQTELITRGFLEDQLSSEHFTKEIRMALVNYQIANDLPIGQLDAETLEELEILIE